MSIGLLDTSVGSENLGDQIIMDAINDWMRTLWPERHKVTYPTHLGNTFSTLQRLSAHNVCFIGGTNLLSPHRQIRADRNLWVAGWKELLLLRKKIVLMGVGLQKDYPAISPRSAWFYQQVLSSRGLHAVRDELTRKLLSDAGIDNVVCTGCPTTWRLDKAHCEAIPQDKAEQIVFTLTKFWQDPDSDRHMIDVMLQAYQQVYFWPQGTGDNEYLNTLMRGDLKGIRILPADLQSYDNLLAKGNIDYAGTRLHGGIRALQHQCRALIVGVDNRAREISKDTGLNVICRQEMSDFRTRLVRPFATRLKLNTEAIEQWQTEARRLLSD